MLDAQSLSRGLTHNYIRVSGPSLYFCCFCAKQGLPVVSSTGHYSFYSCFLYPFNLHHAGDDCYLQTRVSDYINRIESIGLMF